MTLLKSTATHIGTRETNQDRIFAEISQLVSAPNQLGPLGLFCVADGMGGLEEGEYAASVAAETIKGWWDKGLQHPFNPLGRPVKGAEVLDAFFSLFGSINDTIRGRPREGDRRYGTTCSVLLIQGNRYYIAHAGDSRIYKIGKGWFARGRQLTVDHTHPERGTLTSCLGGFERPRIFTCSGEIDKPCTFLLCSDGLHKAVKDKEIAAVAKRSKDSGILADTLVNRALKQDASDNVSVITVKLQKG